MATKKPTKSSPTSKALKLKTTSFLPSESRLHKYGKHALCVTDSKGQANPFKIVVDSSEGFIPLWAEGVTLNWRFDRSFDDFFENPVAAREEIKNLMGESITAWKDACPVRFHENDDLWDFEITMQPDDCNLSGCVLASAFFPGGGQNQLILHPKMFEQTRKEQVETLIHEFGHVFGLRHFFAKLHETAWKSEIFGKHRAVSIMNYGEKSKLTKYDITDLKKLYKKVWNNELKRINGTPIRQFLSYHMVPEQTAAAVNPAGIVVHVQEGPKTYSRTKKLVNGNVE